MSSHLEFSTSYQRTRDRERLEKFIIALLSGGCHPHNALNTAKDTIEQIDNEFKKEKDVE